MEFLHSCAFVSIRWVTLLCLPPLLYQYFHIFYSTIFINVVYIITTKHWMYIRLLNDQYSLMFENRCSNHVFIYLWVYINICTYICCVYLLHCTSEHCFELVWALTIWHSIYVKRILYFILMNMTKMIARLCFWCRT